MATSRVEKRPQALRDLAEIAIHLAEESGSDDLAFRFLDAAEKCFEELAAMPEMGASRQYRDAALANLRMWPTSGFRNYLIFYRPCGGGVEIVRVLHAKRDIEALFGG